MRTNIIFYYFLLDIAYSEFSETDGELDDYDDDSPVVEGDNKNIVVRNQNYLEKYMVP